MKKFLILLCSLTLVLGVTMSASAELVTITFDEVGISAGGCPPQGSGDLITDQYAAWGVAWIVDPGTDEPHNEVTLGECFNNAFDIGSGNQILWYNGNPVEGNIQLDFLADSLAFDYRKPSDTDPVQVRLYNGPTEIYDSGVFDAIGSWQTFTYNAADPSGYFDRILMDGPKKFLIDNLEVNPAPVTITFDEPGITSGPTNDRYDGTQVDTQYSSLGVTWVDTVDDPDHPLWTGQGVTHPDEFNGELWDTDNMLWNYGQGGGGTTPVNAPILLSFAADSFSFEFRRPNAPGTIDVQLYMGDTLVHETIGFSWDPDQDGDWKTFSYSGDPFDKVVLSSGDKFNTDNYSFNYRAPVLDPIGAKTVDEGQLLEFTVTASDQDVGQVLTLSADPSDHFTDNGDGTGTFSWQTVAGDEGDYPVTFTATDNHPTDPMSDSETITIAVQSPGGDGDGGGGGGCFIETLLFGLGGM